MEYRKLPKGDEQIGVVGFGGSGIHQAGEKEGVATILAAMEKGGQLLRYGRVGGVRV